MYRKATHFQSNGDSITHMPARRLRKYWVTATRSEYSLSLCFSDCFFRAARRNALKENEEAMGPLQLTPAPVAQAEMLIRKPAAEVFKAFIDPGN